MVVLTASVGFADVTVASWPALDLCSGCIGYDRLWRWRRRFFFRHPFVRYQSDTYESNTDHTNKHPRSPVSRLTHSSRTKRQQFQSIFRLFI